MTAIGETDLEEVAKAAAGNWRHFDCFLWDRQAEIENPEEWAIFYTDNKNSKLTAQSNAAVINKALRPFTRKENDPDVVFERHNHWLCGYVNGFSVRVFKRGKITRAFKKYYDLVARLEHCTVLDEKDYDRREAEATRENIVSAAWSLKREFVLPKPWARQVHVWLEAHGNSLENTDDEGGWPSEDDLKLAFAALGYKREETRCESAD